MLDSIWLQNKLVQGKQQGCFPSAAAAIGVHGHVLAQAFVGEAPEPGGTPVDEHTRYDMASLSKVIGTSMVAFRAMEEGRLSLEEKVSDFFPEAPADKADITVFQLMTHTGGFEPFFLLDQLLTDPADTVSCILTHPLAERPGVRPIYSCMGYILLAKMLEKRLGAPLDVLAQRMVFDPLGLAETGYAPDPSSAVFAATEVDAATGRPWVAVVHDENARFQHGISGNAGVFMSLHDAIRFAAMLARGGEGFLRPETLEKATQNYTPGQDQHRGLGFQMSGSPDCFFSTAVPEGTFGHTGFTGTCLLVEPRTGFWAILLTNRVYPTRDSSALFPFRRMLHAEAWSLFHAPMDARELYDQIELPSEIHTLFSRWDEEVTPRADEDLTRRLLTRAVWADAVKELEARIGEDPDHLRILWEELRIARLQWPKWLQAGIPLSIYRDTMRFATRYLYDYQSTYGRFGFSAPWWFQRPLAMELFRLGSLEFELVPHEEGKRIYIHIPTDASLAPEAIDDSLARCRAFLRDYYPDWADAPIWCDSWLMSPTLAQFLPSSSRILGFQRRFEIRSFDPESLAALTWVYPGFKAPTPDLPEKTSLQRSMKPFLLAGNRPGAAEGILR